MAVRTPGWKRRWVLGDHGARTALLSRTVSGHAGQSTGVLSPVPGGPGGEPGPGAADAALTSQPMPTSQPRTAASSAGSHRHCPGSALPRRSAEAASVCSRQDSAIL